MQKFLIIAGIVILLAGLFWPFLSKIHIGRLPGDIIIDKPNMKIFIPVTTMILASIILTIIMRFFRK